ncbi:MAG: type 1 glutamine amidotransferase [Actinobacteria bacterium]|nr:type 1 glutamine amidotransferase [Actinomycetota bacterium]
MAKRLLFIEHDHVSPTGPLGERFADHGYEISAIAVVPEEQFNEPNVVVTWPEFTDYDIVVPLGSPWGVWEDQRIGNWLLPELELAQKAHDAGVPIMGVCFGGQLMARALGGRVERAERAEVGWLEIQSDSPNIPSGPWFQYHWDRWYTPSQATEIARTSVGPQAFIARRTLALQFHPEINLEILDLWLAMEGGCAEVESVGIDPENLRAETKAVQEQARTRTHALVDYFLRDIATAE